MNASSFRAPTGISALTVSVRVNAAPAELKSPVERIEALRTELAELEAAIEDQAVRIYELQTDNARLRRMLPPGWLGRALLLIARVRH